MHLGAHGACAPVGVCGVNVGLLVHVQSHMLIDNSVGRVVNTLW